MVKFPNRLRLFYLTIMVFSAKRTALKQIHLKRAILI